MKYLMRLFLLLVFFILLLNGNPIVDQAYENYIQIHGDVPPSSERSFFDKYFWIFILGFFLIQKYFPLKKKNDE